MSQSFRLIERGGQFLVGNCLTWADIQLYHFSLENPGQVEKLHNLGCLAKRVGDLPNIKKWIETRPKTAM